MAQSAGFYLHDNWEMDMDDLHNEHQPIHENVEGEQTMEPTPTRRSLSGLSSSNSNREIVFILRLPVVPSPCSRHPDRRVRTIYFGPLDGILQ